MSEKYYARRHEYKNAFIVSIDGCDDFIAPTLNVIERIIEDLHGGRKWGSTAPNHLGHIYIDWILPTGEKVEFFAKNSKRYI